MKIKKALDVNGTVELPGVVKREVVNQSDGAPNFCMRVFEVQPGSATPSHSHNWEHEIFILEGNGAAVGPHGETPVSQDSVVFIPANEHHCIMNKGDSLLRLICVIPFVK